MPYLKSDLGEEREDELELGLIDEALGLCDANSIVHAGGDCSAVCMPTGSSKPGEPVCPNVCVKHSEVSCRLPFSALAQPLNDLYSMRSQIYSNSGSVSPIVQVLG